MNFGVWRGLLMIGVLAMARGAWGLDAHRELGQYGRQVWQTENGLPQNTVRAVAQTKAGWVWLGTDDGLVRFDGNEFKVFTAETTPALGEQRGARADGGWRRAAVGGDGGWAGGFGRGGRIQGSRGGGMGCRMRRCGSSTRTGGGGLWVATAGGLCVMRGVRCELVAATKGMSVTGEERFAEGPDGAIWQADGAEMRRLDGGTLAQVEGLKTVGGAEVLALLAGPEGRLLVGTREGLQVARGGALEAVPLAGAQGRVAVNAMMRGGDGGTWLGTSAGLWRVRAEDFGAGMRVSPEPVQTLFLDREGAVWAGTSRGVLRVVGDRVEGFRAGDALAGASLLALLEDREGDVWLGTEADGLTMLHEQKFTSYTTAEGLSGNVVRSVLQDAAGTVWAGTDGAGLDRWTGDGFTAMTTKAGLTSDVILALAAGADGRLWVGTPTGLNVVRGGRVTAVLTAENGLADDFVRSLLVDRRGDVWVGTRHGLTRIAAGGGMTTYTAMDGLGSDFIGAMIEARNGDLWIGTSGGLTRLDWAGPGAAKARFTNFEVKDGLAKNVVTAMLEDRSGVLWLGTSGGGLSRLDARKEGASIVPVPATNLPQAITGVLEDGAGRLWIGSRGGVFRVAETALNRAIEQGPGTVEMAAYDTSDGMRTRECSSGGHPAAVRMRDGSLWFATLRGVSVVDPERLHENAVPPPVVVETVQVNDVAQMSALERQELVVPPGGARVEFQYAGLSFVAPQKVEYRYWLEGFDPYWVEAGRRRAAFYTNLRPGRYVFHVAAANNDGVWSEVDATVRLRVRPFFWQTWWFYGLGGAGRGGSGVRDLRGAGTAGAGGLPGGDGGAEPDCAGDPRHAGAGDCEHLAAAGGGAAADGDVDRGGGGAVGGDAGAGAAESRGGAELDLGAAGGGRGRAAGSVGTGFEGADRSGTGRGKADGDGELSDDPAGGRGRADEDCAGGGDERGAPCGGLADRGDAGV